MSLFRYGNWSLNARLRSKESFRNLFARTTKNAINRWKRSSKTSKTGIPRVVIAAPTLGSIEDQQRHLIDLAHEAADRHDYESAEKQLDEAAELNGPLNGLIADLRHQFSERSHGAELQRAAREEQTLW